MIGVARKDWLWQNLQLSSWACELNLNVKSIHRSINRNQAKADKISNTSKDLGDKRSNLKLPAAAQYAANNYLSSHPAVIPNQSPLKHLATQQWVRVSCSIKHKRKKAHWLRWKAIEAKLSYFLVKCQTVALRFAYMQGPGCTIIQQSKFM